MIADQTLIFYLYPNNFPTQINYQPPNPLYFLSVRLINNDIKFEMINSYNKPMSQSLPPHQPPRKKQPNDAQLKDLKNNLQILELDSKHNVYYNLSTKQSQSGFFNNDRLIVMNTKTKVLGYVSKIPEYQIPFYNQEEVNCLKFKSKVTREGIVNGDIKDFKCQPVLGKQGNFQVSFKKGPRNQADQWVMEMKNQKLMYQWIEHINQTLLKDQPKQQQKPPEQPQPPFQPQPQIPMQTIVEQQYQPQYRQSKESNKILAENSPTHHFGNVMWNNNQLYQNSNTSNQSYLRPEQSPQNTTQFNQVNPIPQVRQSHPQQNINTSNVVMTNISYEDSSPNNSVPIPIGSAPNSSRIVNMPYADHVTELQYLKKQEPQRFKLDNQLSQKKIGQNINNQNQQYQNQQQRYNQNVDIPNIYTKKSQYEEIQIQNQPFARTNSHTLVQKKPQNSNIRYDESARGEVEPSSKRNLANSYLINSQIKHSRSGSPLPYQKSQIVPESMEYQRYTERDDKYQMQEPNIYLSRSPQQSKVQQIQLHQSMAKKSSKPNITIQNKNRTISNVLIQDSHLQRRPETMERSNFMSKSSNVQSIHSHGSRKGLSRRKWNQVFAETVNKLQIYEEFTHTCYNIVRDVVNELPLDKNRKDYLPIESKPPYYTYYNEGIVLTLHRFDSSRDRTSPTAHTKAPLLFDQQSYQLLKREFYNYNLLLSVTANQGFIKVPLCAFFQYKGILVICKAQIPQNFSEVTPKRYQQQFQIIEEQINLRFIFGSFNAYMHPNSRYLILDNLSQLVPELPIGTKQGHFFRKQFLLSYDRMIQDVNDIHEANDLTLNKYLPELLSKLQSLDTFVVSQNDLLRIFHENGLSMAYIPQIIQLTTSPFLKKLFITHLVSTIFTSIFRSQIHNLYSSFSHQFSNVNLDQLNHRILQSSHLLLEMLFSYNNQSQQLWKIIVQQCKIKYRVSVSKEDLIAGYLLASVVDRMGLDCNFRQSSFNKHEVQFFAKQGNIPKDLLQGFRIKVRRYDLGSISSVIQNIQQIITSHPTHQNFKILVDLLNLKTQVIPNYLQPYQEQILVYLCNFVPYSQHQQFQHIGIYNMVLLQPHSFCSSKCCLLAIKWCAKKKFIDEAVKIYEMKELENAFWQGQYNPAISQFYDFFSIYYSSTGQFDHSIQLAKMSLKNIIKVLGSTALPVADKHYQLGNIYIKLGRKEESLKQFTRTKQILKGHGQTTIPEYAVILLKLSVLYLNFGKVFEAVNHALEALKIFDSSDSSEEDQINTFEVLSRCYQITKKQQDLQQICALASQKFNITEQPLIFIRMLKLSLYVKLKSLSTPQAKAMQTILSKLSQHSSNYSQMEAFSFLNRKCQSEILIRKIDIYLQNILYMYEQASKKDSFRRYKSLDQNPKNQVEEMLVIFEAIGILIGFQYMVGSMRQTYD